MDFYLNLSRKLNCIDGTLYFFRKHFLIVLGLGLVAAFGRVVQLGGFGEITSSVHVILEIVIESARILLFLYVLGLANIKTGFLRMKKLFTHKQDRKLQFCIAAQNFKNQWKTILLNFLVFALIAWILNYLIDLLAYETCLYLSLKENGILTNSSSEWTILLFFKNLSVIPFTLVFETLFFLHITNKLGKYRGGPAS